ncbi:MAG: polysulfide reductase NrfD [Acidimicrobiales bacterium]|nr:polysulfide reductase NrfD [Acidimicrobiales bacterium]
MTRLGFLLDSETCIGCHACTVACKSEHDVPLGVNRTWVKYIETGEFPDTTRHFSVMRCNQCDDAPCMEICPTSALFRADNGVVDFDDDNCIGCKGCMNACPYDAIYINPDTNTANKCNFCNHRVEVGLEPSCVVVCPTHSIKVIDFDDPDNGALQNLDREDLAVRSPEQGTTPMVYYRGAHEASLDPLRTAIPVDGLIWADVTPQHPTPPTAESELVARTTYTTAHATTWQAKVSSYLVTKAVAAGVMLFAALMVVVGHVDQTTKVGFLPALIATFFLLVTGALLVADLKKPSRFYLVLTRGNRSSWLVRGAYILGVYAVLLGGWLLASFIDSSRMFEVLAGPVALVAASVAGYTAFLFAQCEGRDLWQGRLLLPTLLTQAVAAGGAVWLIADLLIAMPEPVLVQGVTIGALTATSILILAEVLGDHSPHVAAAVRSMTQGDQRNYFLAGIVGGLVVPIILLIVSLMVDAQASTFSFLAGIFVLVGMWAYEHSYVQAGQSVPLS